MNEVLKILLGVVLLGGGLYSIWKYLPEFVTVLKGLVPPLIVLLGLLIIWIEKDELSLKKKK